MSNKPNKPIQLNPVQRPLTDEEKQARAMQFLAQKREQYALNILCNICREFASVKETGTALVDIAVKMADHLLEKLYPIKEESK